MFKNTVAPMLKRGAKAAAKEALKTGVGVASDMLEGRSVHESIHTRLPAAGKRLARRGIKRMNKMIDAPPQKRRKTIKGRRVDTLGY